MKVPLTVVLIALSAISGSAAQDSNLSPSPDTAHLQEPEYNKLRRGAEMRFHYIAIQPPGTKLCINVAEDSASGRVPLKLELVPEPGLTISAPAYPDPKRAKSEVADSPRGCATEVELKMKVRAANDLPLGPHIIRGRLTWQTMGVNGMPQNWSKAIEIPLEVVESSTSVTHNSYFQKVTPLQVVRVVALGPFVVGYALVCAVGQGVGVDCGN